MKIINIKSKKFLAIFIIFILIMGCVIFFCFDSENIEISHYKIKSKKIYEEIKIVQISDLHSKTFKKENSLLENIKNIDPDIIVITGDMSNSTDNKWEELFSLCENLSKYKIIYINGNHEQALEMCQKKAYERNISYLESLDVVVLRDNSIELTVNNSEIVFSGLEIPLNKDTGRYMESKYIKYSYIENALGEICDSKFNLLLAHTPEYFEYYSKWGADLVLSGHIHGGIIRLPIIGGVLSPTKTLFPKYDGGKYKDKNSLMIVNRGLGTSSINFRFNNKPEISVIKLEPSNK